MTSRNLLGYKNSRRDLMRLLGVGMGASALMPPVRACWPKHQWQVTARKSLWVFKPCQDRLIRL